MVWVGNTRTIQDFEKNSNEKSWVVWSLEWFSDHHLTLEGKAGTNLLFKSLDSARCFQGGWEFKVRTLWVAWSSFWVSKEAPMPRWTPLRSRTL